METPEEPQLTREMPTWKTRSFWITIGIGVILSAGAVWAVIATGEWGYTCLCQLPSE